MRFGLLVALLAVPIFSQVVSKDCPQVFLDTSAAFHQLKDLAGEELKGTRRNAGEKKMFGTFAIGNPCLVPFVLRLTFDNGGAFGMELWGKKRYIRMLDPELRYRDRNDVSITKKFSRAASKSSGYVYELQFLKEDMQALYKMELWSFLNEREAKSAVGGVYEETIQFEIESQYFRADKDSKSVISDTADNTGGTGMKKKRRR